MQEPALVYLDDVPDILRAIGTVNDTLYSISRPADDIEELYEAVGDPALGALAFLSNGIARAIAVPTTSVIYPSIPRVLASGNNVEFNRINLTVLAYSIVIIAAVKKNIPTYTPPPIPRKYIKEYRAALNRLRTGGDDPYTVYENATTIVLDILING